MPQNTMALHYIQLTLRISLQFDNRTKDFVPQGEKRKKFQLPQLERNSTKEKTTPECFLL